MSATTGRLIFVFLLVVNCIIWVKSPYGQPIHSKLLPNDMSLVKRISYELLQPQGTNDSTLECRPLDFPLKSQCQHVQDCPGPATVLGINHLRYYFCTDTSLRPLVFTGLVFWLIFLFSTLGISASDFFTPNLATIAQMLGLDENVAGVTFLAFGNGSPDLFSTFSAMDANSGSLAIGELLGAATFIVSCVVGSMCIIKPFKVHPTSFLRDVGFFFMAVNLMLLILWDGRIDPWEAAALVAMYVVYVLVVVVSSWWDRKREHKQHMDALIRAEYAEEPNFQPYTDQPTSSLVTPPPRIRSASTPAAPRLQIATPSRQYSRSPSPTSPYVAQLPSFSILGALEFREVVASLENEAAATSLNYFESPVTPYAGGHYHVRNLPGACSPLRTPRSSSSSSIDETTLIGSRLRSHSAPAINEDHRSTHPDEPNEPNDYFGPHQNYPLQIAPSIYRIPPSPSTTVSDAESDEPLYTPLTKGQCICVALRKAYHILFPTLHNLGQQSRLTQIACILAAPAVLCLTVTLPVVVTPYNNLHASHEKIYGAPLVDFEEEGIERTLIAEQEVEENIHELSFSRWLTAVQCVLGPLFSVQVFFGGMWYTLWLSVATLVAGLVVGTLVIIFADTGLGAAGRMTRCGMGFVVSTVWIMAIADEVVNVLQTFGLIFGLSDAIIGLTIFAVGNSLADLVANMSVAVFAPIMGFSACFGGPMLNILLGVGVSGSYLIHQSSQPYFLKLSTTLFVSCFGLLFLLAATLFFVPLNGYFLSRRWGVLLIATYIIIMVINVIVELKS